MLIDCRGSALDAPMTHLGLGNELDEVDHVGLDEDELPVISMIMSP